MPAAQNDYRHLLLSQNWTGAQWSEWCEHENLIEGLNTIQPHLLVASKCVHIQHTALSIHTCTKFEMYNHNNVTLFANVVLEPFFTPFLLPWCEARMWAEQRREHFYRMCRGSAIKCWMWLIKKHIWMKMV